MESEHAPASPMAQGDQGLQRTPLAILVRLLVRLFSRAARITAFVASYTGLASLGKTLPADSVSVEEMAFALAVGLEERGLITSELFREFLNLRPFNAAEIQQAAQAWGIELDISNRPFLLRSRMNLATIFAGVLVAGFLLGWLLHRFIVKRGLLTIDPYATDLAVYNVVSRKTGKSWYVEASMHRAADSAARDMFTALFLNGDRQLAFQFASDRFRLCQYKTCYSEDTIGALIPADPVWIERSAARNAASSDFEFLPE